MVAKLNEQYIKSPAVQRDDIMVLWFRLVCVRILEKTEKQIKNDL